MSKFEEGHDMSEKYEIDQMQDVGTHEVHIAPEQEGLKRDLRLRHMVMIAISGTIGTGLFLTSGSTIATAGPGGALLAYALIGLWLVFVCQAIGEIATLLPLPGAFNAWGGRIFDEAFSFQMTYMYFINWALTIPAELSASAVIVEFWIGKDSSFPSWVVPVIIIVLMVFINMAGVQAYGELEYWFSILKVLTIIIFIVCGILVDAGAIGGTTYGVSNWHIEGAPFKGGFMGFLTTLVSVGYAYGGSEMTVPQPHKHVPKAVNTVLVRIAFFYLSSIFLLGSIVANSDPLLINTAGSAAQAPFTIVFVKAGLKGAANYMNAVVFTSVFSAINSDYYIATRMLLSLSRSGWAHKKIGYTNSRGVPVVALGIVTACSCLSLITIFVGSGVVFQWFVSIIGSILFQSWILILFLHFRFRYCWKARALPYASWGYPYGNILATIIGCCCIIATWYLSIINPPRYPGVGATDDLLAAYRTSRDAISKGLLGAWFPWIMSAILFFSYKFAKGTTMIRLRMPILTLEDLKPHGPAWKRVLKMFV
ncbi:MAG: amino acid permease-domain-containing protein [Linnemannia elongata]|nr:MAG: amino acid permease-domain-containing protein [Linnemannia elongata]